ncbi:MAG: recombination factor protein RarA, partial [Salinisphaeraceae bacterium]|nr:recombination factor protein RarA [Salinisphaeraceae bacterium]
LLERALQDAERGLGALNLECNAELLEQLALAADGDARRALNLLDLAAGLAQARQSQSIEAEDIAGVLEGSVRRFDKGGEYFYDQISALHKSVRGSDPDAALYWFCRMVDGGCDPRYIARRVLRMASEDIGLADPRGQALALQGWETYERLGSPEGELAIAQAVVYLASTAKSNAVYTAYKSAMADVRASGSLEVPLHLRNAPTKLMKSLDYGKDYRYAHDEIDGFAAGENYFPEQLRGRRYYEPVERGLETKIAEKLTRLRAANKKASK